MRTCFSCDERTLFADRDALVALKEMDEKVFPLWGKVPSPRDDMVREIREIRAAYREAREAISGRARKYMDYEHVVEAPRVGY